MSVIFIDIRLSDIAYTQSFTAFLFDLSGTAAENMYRYFKGKIRKFIADPPELLEDIVEDNMPYMGTVSTAS